MRTLAVRTGGPGRGGSLLGDAMPRAHAASCGLRACGEGGGEGCARSSGRGLGVPGRGSTSEGVVGGQPATSATSEYICLCGLDSQWSMDLLGARKFRSLRCCMGE